MKARSIEFLREVSTSDADSKAVRAACGWAANEIERLQAKDASEFQAEPYTKVRDDKWLILALRTLGYMERDDVVEGLEAEFERLQQYPKAIASIRARYPIDVFPDTNSAAQWARKICDNIEYEAAKAEGE